LRKRTNKKIEEQTNQKTPLALAQWNGNVETVQMAPAETLATMRKTAKEDLQ
jgi:hypothetical protein